MNWNGHERPRMVFPPTGTVTFLFTDIEGSTKLAQQFPDVWPATHARHRQHCPGISRVAPVGHRFMLTKRSVEGEGLLFRVMGSRPRNRVPVCGGVCTFGFRFGGMLR